MLAESTEDSSDSGDERYFTYLTKHGRRMLRVTNGVVVRQVFFVTDNFKLMDRGRDCTGDGLGKNIMNTLYSM